jgi:hypothetical protein
MYCLFCRCIESFTRLVCPLCRSYFDPRSVRRLHIDLSSSPVPSPAARLPRAVPADDADNEKEDVAEKEEDRDKEREKEGFKARLVGMVREGAGAARYAALLTDITAWLKEQSREDVRRLPCQLPERCG